jgi:RNA-directed DNA polymerase
MIHNSIVSCDHSQNDVIRGYVSYINSIEEGYKDKIIDYINRLKEKDYKHDKELVKQFNLNKLYKEVKDMEYQEIPYGSEDEIDYFTNRYYYLLERGLIEDEDLEIDQSNGLATPF